MNKHIELFKKIPCGNFGASKLFFDIFKKKQAENITKEDILLAYYYISKEMFIADHTHNFITHLPHIDENLYDFFDPVTGTQESIHESKMPKLYNGLFRYTTYRNKKCKVYTNFPRNKTGLIAEPKIPDGTVLIQLEDFGFYAPLYKSKYLQRDYFTEEKPEINPKDIEHLYNLLNTITNEVNFYYREPKSIILTQELASVMANHDLIKKYQHFPNGANIVHKHKLFMFGELQR